ncbi:Ig-like domain-containing protein [Candidatus Palauibacter soopunensis]|uniref:Ig-like domain-containing protein n=1 Tax=Candidatus Palauibacter soopunensis TaxID=3056739 RepID=UPI00239FF6EF|nr:Ig-like domain-containing protein [Candidatus Palauibacter soopunensis]MDE2879420.1 Ig-like domain-containing protein [Candidatus Palauibacter soopunensis]
MLGLVACGESTSDPASPSSPAAPRPATVTLTPETVEMNVHGGTARLTASVLDQNGRTLAGAGLEWASSDTLVVRVDGSGLLTAVGDGSARVTARAGSATGSAEATVRVMAYLTQAVQSRRAAVPLVAGRDALLRVFVTAERSTGAGLPPVRARFHLGGAQAHEVVIPAQTGSMPTEVEEGDLLLSANATIPGEIVRPGLEMVIEIDPDGTLETGLLSTRRIPQTGRASVEVHDMPRLDLTLIPFIWSTEPDSAIIDIVRGIASDPDNHELLRETRTLMPVGSLDVTAHDPVLSSRNNANALLGETSAIRVMESGSGFYMGTMSGRLGGFAGGGLAQLGGRASVSIPRGPTMAHELGHNLFLRHAPCGSADPDPAYPYPDGSIGAWGYDSRDGGSLIPPSTSDVMSYCSPGWISDYSFSKALRYRVSTGADASISPSQVLLLWGGVDDAGKPFLEPSFLLDAPPALPQSRGDYEIKGYGHEGEELFSLTFGTSEIAHGAGGSGFAFALPVQPALVDALASITLAGPAGRAAIDRQTDRPMAILRDTNGQVRAILRDPPADIADNSAGVGAGTLLSDSGIEALVSRGIPERSEASSRGTRVRRASRK